VSSKKIYTLLTPHHTTAMTSSSTGSCVVLNPYQTLNPTLWIVAQAPALDVHQWYVDRGHPHHDQMLVDHQHLREGERGKYEVMSCFVAYTKGYMMGSNMGGKGCYNT
jgi:hypothetical protein